MNEVEISIAQKILPRDWTPLRKVVPGVGDVFKRNLDLVMINRYLHEGVLELMLVRPDGTTRQFSRADCAHLTISAVFHRAEGVWVEPCEDGEYFGRLAELTPLATTTLPADQQPTNEHAPNGERPVKSPEGDAQPQPQSPNSPIAEVRKLSGKTWVQTAYERRPKELLAMGITGASRELAEEAKTAPDCAKPLTARYIEKLLRTLGAFPKAHRGRKQRPK